MHANSQLDIETFMELHLQYITAVLRLQLSCCLHAIMHMGVQAKAAAG